MPLYLHASGTGGFSCRCQNVDVGEVFSAADFAGLMDPSAGVLETAGSAVWNETTTSNFERAGVGVSDQTFGPMFRDAAINLMTRPGQIELFFDFRNDHWHGINESGNRHLTVPRGLTNPSWLILGRITPVMERVGMNNSGVLLGIADIFNRYARHEVGPAGSPDRVASRPTTYDGPRRLNIHVVR